MMRIYKTICLVIFGLVSSSLYAGDNLSVSSGSDIIVNERHVVDVTANNAIIRHVYNNAGYSVGVDIYIESGWTVQYKRPNESILQSSLRYWLDADFGNKWSAYLSTGSRTVDLQSGKSPGTLNDDYGCYITSNVQEADAPSNPQFYIQSAVTLELLGCSPVNIHVYTKRYGFQWVFYDWDGATKTVDSGVLWTLQKNYTYTMPAAPVHNGYKFEGWNQRGTENVYATGYDVTKENEVFWTSADSGVKVRNFDAKYSVVTYNITYDLGAADAYYVNSEPADSQKTYTVEKATFSCPTPVRPGWIFKGWKVNGTSGSWADGATITEITKGNYGTLALVAQWERNKYAVTGSITNGSVTPATQTIEFESNCAAMTFTPAKNYRLSGVKVDVDLDGTKTTPVNEIFNPVKETYSYQAPVTGTTVVTVSTTRVSADVTIKRTGMSGNDCSIVQVTGNGKSYTLILNSSNNWTAVLDQVPCGTYTCTETNWAYTYNKVTALQTLTIAATDANDPTVTFAGDKKTIDIFNTETHN